MKYRENDLDFRSWICVEDVKAGEEILMEIFGCDYETAQNALDRICDRVFDFGIYEDSPSNDDYLDIS